MQYLWQDYDDGVFYFAKNEISAPYVEKCAVIRSGGGTRVEINPLLRFAEIFRPLFAAADDEDELRQIENQIFHRLAEIDLMCSTRAFTLIEDNIRRELEMGCYGERAANLFNQLTAVEQSKMITLLRRQEQSDGRRLMFREAVQTLFSGALIYFYADERRFLIYIPQNETESARKKLKFIKEMFLDFVSNDLKVFWNVHFGIIGRPRTMRLDETVLY